MFGELDQYTATLSGKPVLDVQYTRDDLGRVTQQEETIALTELAHSGRHV